MKRIFLLVLVFISLKVFAQYPNGQQTIGNDSNLIVPKGALKGRLINHVFIDTADANLQRVRDYPGAQIFTSSDEKFWLRNSTATEWLNFVVGATGQDTVYVADDLYVTWEDVNNDGNLKQVIHRFHNDGLVSGGIITWSGTGLKFYISPAIYYLGQVRYETGEDSVTLDPADPTFGRVDAFILDTIPNADKITGTAAASPTTPAQPTDPLSQILLGTFLLNAGDTVPSNIVVTKIYDENIEWTTSSTGTIVVDFNDIVNPYINTKAAYVSSYETGARLIFTYVGNYPIDATEVLTMRIYSNGQFNNSFRLHWRSGGTLISSTVILNASHGFNPQDSNRYQLVTVPISAFTFIPNATTYNRLYINMVGTDNTGSKGFYIDNIQLQRGINNIPPPVDYSNKVDSVTRRTDSLFYWIKGIPKFFSTVSSGGAVTPAALTKTDDTNVTLTLGGTPTTALLQATSMSLGWTGTLAATRGGTGTGIVAVGDILYGSAVNTWSKLIVGSDGEVLTLVAGIPSWAAGGSSSSVTTTNLNNITDYYVFPVFQSASGTEMKVMQSVDGITWSLFTTIARPSHPEGSGDFSIIYRDGKFRVVCSNTRVFADTTKSIGYLESSDLLNWTLGADINLSSTPSARHISAPHFFVDSNDSLSIFYQHILDSPAVNGKIYRVKQVTDGNYTSWSTPIEITTSGFPAKMLDVYLIKRDSIYYMWYKNEVTKYQELASATNIDGPYTTIQTGDWTGWGTFTEGVSIVPMGGSKWRAYFEQYNATPTFFGYYYSESNDDWATWSTKVHITDPFQPTRGGEVLKMKGDIKISPHTGVYWALTGNSGTTVGTNFLGTTDDEPLMFKVKGVKSGYIDSTTATTGTTAFGYSSILNNTGLNNSAFGFRSLRVNSTGADNSAFGSNSLGANTTGINNTAFGSGVLTTNIVGNYNTAFGAAALSLNTGSNNTAIGYRALFANTTGGNVAIGYQSLQANTTASGNTAIGQSALTANTTGATNTAIGLTALGANTTGLNNTAIGVRSAQGNTTGRDIVSIGYETMTGNSTGGYNIGIGTYALYGNTTGSNNIGIGQLAGIYVANNTTSNTVLDNSILIGYRTKALAVSQTNQIVIGYDALGLGSNSVTIGNSSTTKATIGGALAVSNTPKVEPATPAQLDIRSTSKGVLFPRMTSAQRDAIVFSAGIESLTLTPGSGYTDGSYAITFSSGGGSGAAGTLTVAGGVFSSTIITNYGTGYTSAPTASATVPAGSGGAITVVIPNLEGLTIFCTDCTATDASTGVLQTRSSSSWRNHY